MSKKNKANKAQPQSPDAGSEPSGQNNEAADNEFPGYPHYPAQEDIMNTKDAKRVPVDVENFSRSNLMASSAQNDKSKTISQVNPSKAVEVEDDDDVKIVSGTEADVTADDLILLREKDMDLGRSGILSGEDLDVPGSEDDDANEDIGEEDEENNYYSLGGDAHENLEEDKG